MSISTRPAPQYNMLLRFAFGIGKFERDAAIYAFDQHATRTLHIMKRRICMKHHGQPACLHRFRINRPDAAFLCLIPGE